MDIAGRPDDPAIEEMARSIFALFPRCMRCGEPITRYEDADIRILSQRVVHRGRCAEEDEIAARNAPPATPNQLGNGSSSGIPREG